MSTSAAAPPPRRGSSRRLPVLLRLAPLAVGAILALSVAVTVTATTARVTAPQHASPGSRIVVRGAGFGAGQTGKLTYDGAAVARFAASSSGWFNVPLIIPTSAAIGSTGRISAKDVAGNLLATTMLQIAQTGISQESLSVPTQAQPGSTITVSGSRFAAGSLGYLTINGLKVTTFVASLDGSFSVPFAIPTTIDIGTDRISARDNSDLLIATSLIEVNTGPIATDTPAPTPSPTDTPAPTDTPVPTDAPTDSPAPTDTSAPTDSPTDTPSATDTPAPTDTPVPTNTPTDSPAPTDTPVPTDAPTDSPAPTPPATDTPAPTPTATAQPTASPPGPALPNFSHVYWIVFENREYSSIVGSSQAPYINSLIAQYGLATDFTAVSHPSEPNYIALTSGSTQGIADDGVYDLSAPNLFDQIETSGRTWRAYVQGYPGGCFVGASSAAVVDGIGKSGPYVRKHDPAISYTSISGGGSRCSNISNLAGFDPGAANFEFIVPNLVNDMHDGTVADGDNFLRSFLPQITASAAFANSVVFITFDEGTSNVGGGGHVATIAVTAHMTPGSTATGAYNHYSLLRTLEEAWGLRYLGNAASATAIDLPY